MRFVHQLPGQDRGIVAVRDAADLVRALEQPLDVRAEGGARADPNRTDPSRLHRMLLPSQDSAISFLTASESGRLVGYSLLTRRLDTGEAQFASTAVRPSMRGHRIATALRARCILSARHDGFATVRSASGSAALIRINARFGFQETYSEVRLVRRLRSTGAAIQSSS